MVMKDAMAANASLFWKNGSSYWLRYERSVYQLPIITLRSAFVNCSTEPMTLDYSELDSFVILIAVKGEGRLLCDGEETSFKTGDTILLPATTTEVRIEGTVKFLETYV